MKTTSVLRVKQLISKLHPPLPPTPRQASQLQSILRTSFQRHLDQVHPSPQSVDRSGPGNETDHVPVLGSLPLDATNFHLQSILNHPFIDRRSSGRSGFVSGAVKAVHAFESAVVNGTVDVASLESCAISYRRYWANNVEEGSPRLAPKIAAWLAASTAAVRENVLLRSSLMGRVIAVMYIDGMEEAVWEWLKMLLLGSFGPGHTSPHFDKRSYSWLTTEDNFLSYMLRESARRHGVATAVQEYVEACAYRIRSGRSVEGESDDCGYQPLYRSGARVTADILHKRGSHGIPESLYDQLLRFRVPVYKKTHNASSALWPMLPIYHPTRPTAVDLYISLRDPEYVKTLSSYRTIRHGQLQQPILSAVLEGANLLLQAGERNKAHFVLSVAKESFPDALKSNPVAVTAKEVQQACNGVALNPLSAFAVT